MSGAVPNDDSDGLTGSKLGTSAYRRSVIDYFADKAENYDRVDEQVFWRLSDELLWESLLRFVLPALPSAPHILDAGGGTGRWTDRLLRHIPSATCTLIDLSPDMARHARAKAERHGYGDRLTVDVRDLGTIDQSYPESSIDLIISFHNVLGFMADPAELLRLLATRIRPGGLICLFAPNAHHGVYFNLGIGADAVAAGIANAGVGRFTSTMPEMRFFTADGLADMLLGVGCEPVVVSGTPVYVYPGYAETQIAGTSKRLVTLEEPSHYNAVLELEKSVLGERSLAARGNNLFIVARRA